MNHDVEKVLQRLSPEARQVLEAAAEISAGQGFLGVDHLVIGLLRSPKLEAQLRQAGVDPQQIANLVQTVLQAQADIRLPGTGEIFCTPRLWKVLSERAPAVAKRRSHVLVEPDDLLIAVLEEESIPLVIKLKKEMGIRLDAFLARLERPALPLLVIPEAIRPWCSDLTARAEQGELLPLVNREPELKQIVRTLLRPVGPASPVLVGEAGVGKTAIVEGLAQRMVAGDFPQLRGVHIVQANINAMLAGCIYRGMFEGRLLQTIQFAKNPAPGVRVILFIDEIHHIVGAGVAEGAHVDAAQMLLESLGRGEIQIIGATTYEEYEEHIAQNEALSRRFHAIRVREPALEETRSIIQGAIPSWEARFRRQGLTIRFTEQALETALRLSSQYLLSRRLPDKPIQWLMEAGVIASFEGRGEVIGEDVINAVSDATGIPQDIMFRQQTRWTPELWERVLKERVKGQDHVIADISRRILMNLSPLRSDRRRPIGVFLFVGPSGVGKTELAKALAELLFADESRILRLDMSEFADEAGGVRRLIGPPRGSVGAGRGELTEKIRQQPYSIVLLDELEKAGESVKALFLQVFDEGWLSDGVGRKVYFRDAIIIMTSNLGQEEYRARRERAAKEAGFVVVDERDKIALAKIRKIFANAVREELAPELRNRIDQIYVFDPLSHETRKEIAQVMLEHLKERLYQELGKNLLYTEEAVAALAELAGDPLKGARGLQQAFEGFQAWELSPHLNKGDSFLIDAAPDGALRVIVSPESSMGREDPV